MNNPIKNLFNTLFFALIGIFIIPNIVFAQIPLQQKKILVKTNINFQRAQFRNGTSPLDKISKENDIKFYPFQKYNSSQTTKFPQYAFEVEKLYIVPVASSKLEQTIQDLKNSDLFFEVIEEPIFRTLLVPGDPFAQPGDNHLPVLLAHDFYSAWDITTGDTSVVLGIVDTGYSFDNDDLNSNLYKNHADPIDGLNNDGDTIDFFGYRHGLTDLYNGYDISNLDPDPKIYPKGGDHGEKMAGASSAVMDDTLGIVGTCPTCRFMPIKVAPDSAGDVIAHGIYGLWLAGFMGVDVANLSWGESTKQSLPSQFFQDVVNHLVYNLDVVITAAAGNEFNETPYYPASYDNVISVTGVMKNRIRTNTSSYNEYVDIAAVDVTGKTMRYCAGCGFENPVYYKLDKGTSLATAYVTGAAGLVRAHRPNLQSYQVSKLLRVTGDIIDTVAGNEKYIDKLGRFLNPVAALTDTTTPGMNYMSSTMSINGEPLSLLHSQQFTYLDQSKAYTNVDYRSAWAQIPESGDTLSIHFDFANFLANSENLSIRIESKSTQAEMLFDSIYVGAISAGLQFSTESIPFQFKIKQKNGQEVDTIKLKIIYEDSSKNYFDYEYFVFMVQYNTVTSIDEDKKSLNNFTLYPNPSDDKCVVIFKKKIEGESIVSIYDLQGHLIKSESFSDTNQYQLSTDVLASGQYLIKIENSSFLAYHQFIKI